MMNFNIQGRYCHASPREAPLCPSRETLRFAQGDKPLPMLLGKIHNWHADGYIIEIKLPFFQLFPRFTQDANPVLIRDFTQCSIIVAMFTQGSD